MNDGIQRLLPRHNALLRLVLDGTNTHAEMARILDYTPQQVSNVINSPVFQMELSRRRKDQEVVHNDALRDGTTLAKQNLSRLALAATEKMEQVLCTTLDPKIQLDAADKILKYALPKDGPKGNTTNNIIALDSSKLDTLRLVLRESGYSSELSKPVVSNEVPTPQMNLFPEQEFAQ